MIVEVDGKPTPTVEALDGVLQKATKDKKDNVPLLVGFERAGQRLLTVIDVGRAGLEDPGLEARKAWVPVSVQVADPGARRQAWAWRRDRRPGDAGARQRPLRRQGSRSAT